MTDAPQDGTGARPAPSMRRSGPVRLAGAKLHPLLVCVPIGAYVCAVAFDVASRLSEGKVYARGALWLLTIGLVSSLVAGVVGAVDGRRRLVVGDAERLVVSRHILLNLTAFALFVVSLVLRRNDLDALADGTPTAPLVLAAVGLVVVVAAAVVGGGLDGRLDRLGS